MRLSNSSLSRFLAGSAVALVMASPAFADSQEELDEINLPTMSANTERTPQGQEEAVKPFEGDNLGNHIGTEKIQATRGMEITGGYSLAVSGGGSIYVTDGGDLRLQNGAITGLANPVNRDDASTKGYVDNRINGLKTGDDLGSHQAGKTLNMSNFKITNIAPPTAATDAADKSYVDTAIAGTGDDMGDHTATQTIDASNFEIINLGTATTPGSAVNKQYVDQAVTNGTSTSVDEARRINTGTGLTGGGDLSADRTISFSTSWGDARYARGTQTVNTGDGLTGGGSLGSNPTISVDGTVVRTSGAQTIGGKKTFTGDVNLSNRRLLGLANPTGGSDAATKSYVDTAIAGAPGVDNTVVRTFGDQSVGGVKTFTDDVYGKETFYADGFKASVTGFYGRKGDSTIAPTLSWIDDVHTGLYNPTKGQISFSSDRNEVFRIGGSEAKSMVPFDMSNNRITGLATPVDAGDAATKAYVDSRPSGGKADNLGDHTATRALNMNGQQIFGLQAPTAANHAVTKGYVDTAVSGVAGVDNTVVRTFGYQSIGGAKDFSDRIVTKGSSIYIDGPSNRHLWLRNSAGKNLGILYQEESTGMVKLRAYDNGAGTGVKSEIALLQDGRVVSSGTVQAPTFNATSTSGGGFQGIYADTEAQPTFTWSSDTNTGMFLKDQNVIGFTAAGRERMRMTTGGLDMLGRNVTGLADPTAGNHAATKSYVDSAVSGAGVDNTVVRTFGYQAIGGRKVFTDTIEANNGNIVLDGDANRLLWFRNSAGVAKGLVYSDETNKQMKMRLYDPAGSGSVVAQLALIQDGRTISQGKVEAPTFNATSTAEGGFQGIATDSAGRPSFTWSGDTNTGIYKPGSDIVGIATSGTERLRVSSAGTDVKGLKVLNVATPTSGSDAANKSYVDGRVSSIQGVDGTVVRTSGDQTVGGSKTFTSNLVTRGGSLYLDGSGSRHIWFRDTSGKNLGIIFQNNNTGTMHFRAYDDGAGTGTKAELQLRQDGKSTFSGTVEAPTFNATSTSGGGFQGIYADSEGQPTFTWSNDTNTGLFLKDQNVIGFTAAGRERMRMTTSGLDMLGRNITGLANPTGGKDAATKSYVDSAVSGAGVDNTVVRTFGNQSIGGTKTFSSTVVGPTFNATSTTGGGFQGIGGDSAGAPSFTWSGDTNTGMYRTSSDQLGFSTGGSQRLLLTNGQADFSVTPMFDTGNIILRSNGNRAIYFRNNGNSEQALIYHEENSNQLRFFLRNTANSSWVTSLVIDDGGSISPGGNGYFSGNGRGLTDLDANDISSGTVADARLPFRHAASGNTGAVTYNGQSKSNGVFYGGNSDPTSTSRRLNFDGYFAATRMYSNMYLYFSDERLKDDIAVMAQPMEKIRDLRPVTYTWKENGEKAMGLIAQEVEVVYPEIVRESGSGMKAVDYTQLISPMLAAIQELDARLTALETRE